MAFNGINVHLRWCVNPNEEATCTPDIDQYRFFDDEQNHSNLKWSSEYLPLADLAKEAGTALFVITMGILIFEACALGHPKPSADGPTLSVSLPQFLPWWPTPRRSIGG
jgi:hypothetical protein